MSKGNTNHDVGREEKERGDIDVQVLLETSGVFSKLVPDILLNIMSRVPLKSLSQCRWVSKSWYKLIKNPSFAKIQYEWAIKNNSPWVIFWSTAKILYLVDDQVFDNLETSVTAHKLELNGLEQALKLLRVFQTAGYVNGLLCLASDPDCYHPSSIYVCNPITGEHIIIPKSPKYKIPAITAFGFDLTTNEYKVIRFIHDVDKDEECLSSEGEVYTLGSSEWRKIEDVPHIMDAEQSRVLLNGNLHWISDVSDSPIINAFNVGSEKFDVIQLPSHILQRDHSYKHLVVIEGNLCLLHEKSHDKPYEVWVMEDYGVQSSWIKKYSFNSKVCNWLSYGSNDLIKLKNGEFLLHFYIRNEFIGYFDPKKDTLRPIKTIGDRENHHLEHYFRSVVQVGSLFSPKDVGRSRRERKGILFVEETRQIKELDAEFQAQKLQVLGELTWK